MARDPRKTPSPPARPAASFRYIETSALLAALLEQEAGAKRALRADGRRITSALTTAEAFRAVLRARATGRLSAAQERTALRAIQTYLAHCDIVAITDDVLARSSRPFPVEPIRTLDAIHLATAELLGEPPALITIVTRDIRVRANAGMLGYATE